jgi:sugar lactone lactonase YvrE
MNNIRTLSALLFLALSASIGPVAIAQSETVEFDPELWDVKGGGFVEHLGRPSFGGTAFLHDLALENGVVEVDIAIDGRRSYPGLAFRVQSERDYERFYLRPHRAGLYPDALQYVPVFHGAAPWQLYHGEGCTAGGVFPEGEWFTLRIEFAGAQARVFLDGAEEPGLVIPRLAHGVSSGGLGIVAPPDGTAFFSNFRFHPDDSLPFDEVPPLERAPEFLTDWEVSTPFPADALPRGTYPDFGTIFTAGWRPIEAEESGLINVTRAVPRRGRGPDAVLLRTVIDSPDRQRVELNFGYSDEVTIFHNSRPVFSGNSAYQSRDRSFVGAVGLHDSVHLELEAGLNEILFLLSETFGGWGLIARLDRVLERPRVDHAKCELLWETAPVFLTPESIQYDRERDLLYVSNLDRAFAGKREPSGFLSKMNLAGEIVELKWVTGLRGPCGLAQDGDRLYVAERGAVTVVDVESGEIIERHPIPTSVFLNDVACDGKGNVYISDSFPTSPENRVVIYRLADGKVEPWIDDPGFSRVNGLFVDGDRLLVGNTADGTVRSIELAGRRTQIIASIGAGVVDGIRIDGAGHYLVSHWEGPTFRITSSSRAIGEIGEFGSITEILDPSSRGWNVADFEFVAEEGMLLVPTFGGNRVAAFAVTD